MASPASAFGFSWGTKVDMIDSVQQQSKMTHLPTNIVSIHRRSILFSQSSEFGAISSSDAPPRLNPALIEEARARLPWETEKDDDDDAMAEEISSGQRWYETRKILTKLWVLPTDLLSWEDSATAANNGEDKLLSSVPQLIRLPPIKIKASAKTVLSTLNLPPALLRREPLLLTVSPDLLSRGFDDVILAQAKKMECDVDIDVVSLECTIESIKKGACEACKDTPGLLLEAATKLKEL